MMRSRREVILRGRKECRYMIHHSKNLKATSQVTSIFRSRHMVKQTRRMIQLGE